jgi:hypothetical protein
MCSFVSFVIQYNDVARSYSGFMNKAQNNPFHPFRPFFNQLTPGQ